MKWVQLLSQVLTQFSMHQRQLEAAPGKIKGMTVQAGVYLVGVIFLVAFTLTSIVMIFVNLGQQWDSETPTHFSGPITSAFLLFGLGVFAFLASAILARFLASTKNEIKAEVAPAPQTANLELNPLMIFAEEFIKQLLTKLAQPKNDPPSSET